MKSTKELAKELGLLKKKSRNNKDCKTEGMAQLFSYLVVLDFESTCWQNDKFRSQEIIEFPAVLLNLTTGEVESEFQCYVQPQENPILSNFCIQLTGISQKQVDEGIPLFICLKKFSAWLTQQSKQKNFTFLPGITTSNACFVTWSDWDLSVCLHYECRRKQLRRPPEMDYWIDLRATYRKFYDRRPNGLKGALEEVGIDFEGREHSGLHDSRNTAMLVKKMILDGCRLQVTKSIIPDANVATLNNELWRFRASLNSSTKKPIKTEELQRETFPVTTSHSSVETTDKVEEPKNDVEESWFDDEIDDLDMLLCASVETSSAALQQNESTACVKVSTLKAPTESEDNQNELIKRAGSLSHAALNITIMTSSPSSLSSCPNKSGAGAVSLKPVDDKTRFSVELQKRLNFCSSSRNKSCNKENLTPASTNTLAIRTHPGNSYTRTPLLSLNQNCLSPANHISMNNANKVLLTPVRASPKMQTFQKTSASRPPHENEGKENRTEPKLLSLNSSSSSPTISTPTRTFPDGSPGINNTSTCKTPSPLLSTSFGSSSSSRSFSTPPSSSAMSRTPPLCGCGCRTKRRHVRNGGPNHGRTFFSCPKKPECKFFEWEFKHGPHAGASTSSSGSGSSSILSSPYEITSSYMDK